MTTLDPPPVSPGARLGPRFVDALVAGEFGAMRSTLHPNVRFRGLSPHKFLKAASSDPIGGVIRAFRLWFYEGAGDYADIRRSSSRARSCPSVLAGGSS